MQPDSDTTTGLDIIDHLCRLDDLPRHFSRRSIRGFHGRCIGDSAASIRSDVLRIIALQLAGRIKDVNAWVSDAVSQLQCSGAHIGVFTESRVQTMDKHHLIVNAFKRKCYFAISHNAAAQRTTIRVPSLATICPPCDSEFGPRSAGVILVVSASYISGWSNVALDLHGRAIAASLDSCDGSTIRIIGVYGVSGASGTNFLSFPSKSKAESLLNEFLLQQFKLCEQCGLHAVVAGDLNSYQKPEVDHFGGPSAIRPDCITSCLAAQGFYDSFRQKHLAIVAFTNLSNSGGSRLDQIWTKPAIGLSMSIAGSCIIWEWDSHSDHFPAVADLVCELPMIVLTTPLPYQPPWRAFLSKLNDDVYRKAVIAVVAEKISLNKELIDSQRCSLASLRGAFASDVAPNPSRSRGAIEAAFRAIEGNMLEAIPWPQTTKRPFRSACPWQRCLYLIAHLHKLSFVYNRELASVA